MEEGGTDALPDDVPIRAAADELHLLVLHDLLQLGAHLPHLPHRLDVDEVVRAPARRVPDSKGTGHFSHFFSKKEEKKVVFEMHFKAFQAILAGR